MAQADLRQDLQDKSVEAVRRRQSSASEDSNQQDPSQQDGSATKRARGDDLASGAAPDTECNFTPYTMYLSNNLWVLLLHSNSEVPGYYN